MQTNLLLRKGLAVGIILLFVGTGIIPSTAQDLEKPPQPTSRGHWLYVGGSGPGNYTHIQEAINNASNGDTVFVYHGFYNEGRIYINKAINLIGENRNNTIIDSTGYVSSLYVWDNVKISGFTIQNAGKEICVFAQGNNITISQNIICNNGDSAICLYIGDHNQIFDNILRNNEYGIAIQYSDDNEIHDNQIINNKKFGILLEYNRNNRIFSNNISENNVGVALYHETLTVITKNNIYDNLVNNYFEGIGANKWKKNYFGSTTFGPKLIGGKIQILVGWQISFEGWLDPVYKYIPWIQFDWNPAKEPYDI